MCIANKGNALILKESPKTVERISKINVLMEKAINEVHAKPRITSVRLPKNIKNVENADLQILSQAIDNLKKGYLMIKYSLKIVQPHDKFVYLSQDCRFICWKSPYKQNQKRLEIIDIEKVIKEGVQFHIKSHKIKDIKSCLVIIGKQKTLQLQATSENEAQYFKYELLRVMKYWESMSMNYKYSLL